MITGFSQHRIVEQSNLVGADHQSGSDPRANRKGLLLGQSSDERIRRLPLQWGFVDVGVNDEERNRETFQEIAPRHGAGAEDEPMHRRTGSRCLVKVAYSRWLPALATHLGMPRPETGRLRGICQTF